MSANTNVSNVAVSHMCCAGRRWPTRHAWTMTSARHCELAAPALGIQMLLTAAAAAATVA